MDAPAAARPEDTPRVAAAGASLSLIAPIRVGLGAVVLAAALALGGTPRSVVGGFVLGAAFLAFAALADRRALLSRAAGEPSPLPPGARREPWWRMAARAALPSTVTVTALAAVTLATGNLVLGAILGGAVAGMGLAAGVTRVRVAAWESGSGLRLYVEQGGAGRRYVEPRGVREPTA